MCNTKVPRSSWDSISCSPHGTRHTVQIRSRNDPRRSFLPRNPCSLHLPQVCLGVGLILVLFSCSLREFKYLGSLPALTSFLSLLYATIIFTYLLTPSYRSLMAINYSSTVSPSEGFCFSNVSFHQTWKRRLGNKLRTRVLLE